MQPAFKSEGRCECTQMCTGIFDKRPNYVCPGKDCLGQSLEDRMKHYILLL